MIRIFNSLLLGAVVSSRGTKRYNVQSGKSITLVCDENNSDTEFYRSFGVNQPLLSLQGPRYSLKNGKLTISETSLDDDGDYLCGQEKSSKIKLSVIVQPETIQIQEKRPDGTARIIEDRNAVLSGKASKAQLTCSVSPAYPKPKISWILKSTGQEILDTVVESKSVEVNSLLGTLENLENGANSRQRKIINRRRSRRLVQVTSIVTLHLDENRYTDGSDIICQVDQGVMVRNTQQNLGAMSQSGLPYGMNSNSVSDSTSGTSFSHTTQVKLELVTVPRVHRFELESGNRGQLLQGDLLRFRCEAHSTPAVQKYRLFVGNRVIAETGDGVFGEIPAIKEFNREVLSCQGVTDEAGAGAKYELEARLNVKYPPELISTSHLQKTSPHEPATLSCNFDANPEPTIHWFYKKRNSNIGSKIGTGEKLTIQNPSWTNSGEYMCQANNNHGDIKTASAFLSVYGKPRINSAKMMIESDFVEFECDFVSHPEVNGTSVDCGGENGKRSKNDAKPVKISDKRFKIPIESFAINSKCVCKVENQIGIDTLEFQPENPAFFESQIKSENFSSGELILVLICTILFLSAMLLISFGFWVCWKRRMNSGHFSSSNSKLYSPKLEAGSHTSNSSRAEKLSLADSRGSSEFEEKLLKVNGNSYLSQSHPDSSSGISSYVILDGSEPENKKLVVMGAKSTKSAKSVKSAKSSVHGAESRSIHGNSAHGTSAHATSIGNPDISLGSRHSDRHSSANDDSGSSGHGTMAIGSGTLPTRKTKIRKIPSSKSMNCSLNTSASDDLYDPSRIRQISEIMQQVKPARKIKSITHV